MKRFTVTFEVEDEAPPPEMFCDAMKAVWAKGDANMIGGAAVVSITPPVPFHLDKDRLDGCEICHGAKGGVPGNENRIGGKVVCDYCHAAMMDGSDSGQSEGG